MEHRLISLGIGSRAMGAVTLPLFVERADKSWVARLPARARG
jgi:hypothetical protein